MYLGDRRWVTTSKRFSPLGVVDGRQVDEAEEQALRVVAQERDGLDEPVHGEHQRQLAVGQGLVEHGAWQRGRHVGAERLQGLSAVIGHG